MKIFNLQNGAGGNVTARISPAEVITIYGPGIGPGSAVEAKPASGFYPTKLAGVQVAINGVNIPLLYVSANQINAIAPMELASDAAATIRVINGETASPDYPIWVVASGPKTFAPVVNQDGTINSQSNPAPAGSTVTFYATGWQSDFSPLADGEVATVAKETCLGTCTASASTGGISFPFGGPGITVAATVLYGGAAPKFVAGVTQFEVQFGTPASTGTNMFGLTLKNSTGRTILQSVWIGP